MDAQLLLPLRITYTVAATMTIAFCFVTLYRNKFFTHVLLVVRVFYALAFICLLLTIAACWVHNYSSFFSVLVCGALQNTELGISFCQTLIFIKVSLSIFCQNDPSLSDPERKEKDQRYERILNKATVLGLVVLAGFVLTFCILVVKC